MTLIEFDNVFIIKSKNGVHYFKYFLTENTWQVAMCLSCALQPIKNEKLSRQLDEFINEKTKEISKDKII